MKKSIYMVSTYYHALIACVKVLITKEKADLLITDYISACDELKKKIDNSGLFISVYLVKEVEEYEAKNIIDKLLFMHKKNANKVKWQLPVSFESYDNCYLFHEDTWMSRYCQDNNIKFSLIEDALNVFQVLPSSPFDYMVHKNNLRFLIRKMIRFGYFYCGEAKQVIEVEVNDKNKLCLSEKIIKKKVKVVKRSELFRSLNKTQKEKLLDIFVNKKMEFRNQTKVLLITQPLFKDGLVDSESIQQKVYQYIIQEFTNKEDLSIIKPHPRDDLDYSNLIGTGILLSKDMPIEILNFYDIDVFDKGITIYSTSLDFLDGIKYKKVLGIDYLNNISL